MRVRLPGPSRASPGSVSFDVDEFADLADGRRIFLHTPYEWLAGLLKLTGVTADHLRAVPYVVEFGPILRGLLERQTR